ncbi:hypothetical protein P1999_23280, partial [Xanthomonas perforans]
MCNGASPAPFATACWCRYAPNACSRCICCTQRWCARSAGARGVTACYRMGAFVRSESVPLQIAFLTGQSDPASCAL